jgi:Ni2+-binding GTPase involved in maturation of urease and hydrogenase
MPKEDKIRAPGLLLVSGTGRNSGKTTLVCKLIERHHSQYNITAIKISPHIHLPNPSDEAILLEENYAIFRETDPNTGKDSSAMLNAGAREVYYIQANDKYILKAYERLMTISSSDDLFICESGGLREHVEPDLFLIIHNTSNQTIKSKTRHLIPLADAFIKRSGEKLDFDPGRIIVRNERWHIT